MPKLRLHSPASIPGVGSILAIPGEDVSVGRSPDNQLVIPDSSVSPHHARLRRTPSGWLLTDLGQSNGIWVGVRRVSEHILSPGQLFRIGGVALEFLDDGASESSALQPPVEANLMVGAKTDHDSGVRGAALEDLKDSTLRDPSPPPISPASTTNARQSLPSQPTATRRARAHARNVALGLGVLVILGLATALGGYFTLQWMSRSQRSVRPATSEVAPSAPPPVATVQVPPEALLSDKEVTDITQEQQVDVPNVLRFVLPANALHTPTHLVLARTGHQGTPFCNATEFAGPALEVSTLSNFIWARPATLEFPVDVEQLTKSRVPSVAVGTYDSSKQVWSLLPTEYDPVRRVAKAQLWQPGIVALFMVSGPENIATSEHFSLLLEPSAKSGKTERDRAPKALVQLEAALSYYRSAGYRIPNGSFWVCASLSAISRNRALLSVVHQNELTRAHSHALARAAFLGLVPAYLGSRAFEGREFWFDAMASAIASQSLGQHMASNAAVSKRLANSLLADDWPSPALFLNVIARIVDQKIDLFRLWTDTTHVMCDLDAKPSAEMQSRVLPIDMALQEATQRNLLSYYSSMIGERLSDAFGSNTATTMAEFCPSTTRIAPEAANGTVKLEVKNQYSVQWNCLSLEVPASKFRSVRLQLAADATPDVNVQWLRLVPGQPPELKPLTAQVERIDLQSTQTLVLMAANSNMAQNHGVLVRYEDVTLAVDFEPPNPVTVRPGQIVPSALQLGKVASDIKSFDVEWDFGDGTAKSRTEVPAIGAIRTEQTHAWDKNGTFVVRALVFDHERPSQQIGFATRHITVQPVHLELSTVDPAAQPGSEMRFAIRATGPVPEKPQYRLNFGDGTDPSVVSSSEITHAFAKPGEFTVTAQIAGESSPNEVVASAKIVVSIKAAEAPTPSPSDAPQIPVTPPVSSGSVQ